MTTGLTYANVIRQVLDARVADIHTALPAQIVNYDGDTQTAAVQPMVRDFYYDTEGTLRTRSLPVLPAIVSFARGGGYFQSFPLVHGDTGLLVFCELPIDRWRSSGQQSHPINARRHGVSSAVFFPGLSSRASALSETGMANGLLMGKEGGAQLLIDASHVTAGHPTAALAVAIASKVQADLNKLATAFNAHMHATAALGSPSPPTPVPSSIPVVLSGNVASTVLKAE